MFVIPVDEIRNKVKVLQLIPKMYIKQYLAFFDHDCNRQYLKLREKMLK